MQTSDERDFAIRRWSDLQDIDWYILGPVILLILSSVLLLSSAAEGNYLTKQLAFLLPGFLIGFLILLTSIKFWQKNSLLLYLINLLLLVIVLIAGTSALGAQRWIDLGFIKL